MTKRITARHSNRCCNVVRTSSLSLAKIRRDIERREEVQCGFQLVDTGLAATNDTLFKVYCNGRDVLVAICALTTFRFDHGSDQPAGSDSIELLFDPYHDHVGYFQFVLEPGKEVATYHHLPYPDARSTAFPELRVSKVAWQRSERSSSLDDSGLCGEQWLFVRLPAKDVFRNGPVCGFNIVRNWHAQWEPSCWNLASGIGFPDATSFGHLHREPAAGQLDQVQASLANAALTIEAEVRAARRVSATLLDPYGSEVPIAVTASGSTWRAEAKLRRRLSGRYRLYPRRGNASGEPEFVALDLSFPKRRRPFSVGLTVDVVDDLFLAPYTPERLQAEMDLYASCGLKRICWIDYAPPWLQSHEVYPELTNNARESEKRCGDLLPVAVEAAHRSGMEIVGVYKPYDLGARAEPEECTMCAHPDWFRPPRWPITKLRICSTEPIDVSKKPEVRIWISDDNVRYRPYRGSTALSLGCEKRPHCTWSPAGNLPEERACRNWFLEIADLAIHTPYMAIDFRRNDRPLSHRAHALLEAHDADGQPVAVFPASGGDRKGGFLFWTEWPSWRNRSPRVLERVTWGAGTHGISFLPPPRSVGLLEPSFAVAREQWLGRVRRLVLAGADGVDIRTLCHHNGVMDYMAVAFAEPVRSAFREMYGREVTPSWEDCERVRRLRGEFYTDFIRQASEITRAAGKKFITHLECGLEVPPGHDQRMQVYLDWEGWLREDLLDGITLKWWSSQNPFIHERVLPLARKLGVQVHICDRNSSLRSLRAGERAAELCADARDAGFDGLAFYEAAEYKYWTPSGKPELQSQVREAFVRAVNAVTEEP